MKHKTNLQLFEVHDFVEKHVKLLCYHVGYIKLHIIICSYVKKKHIINKTTYKVINLVSVM